MPDPIGNFKIYPRGFLGGFTEMQTTRTDTKLEEVVKKHQYAIEPPSKKTKQITPNPHVERLYAEFMRNNTRINMFDFNEQILQVALNAFGTTSFIDWLYVQYQNNLAGDMHSRFLLDTLKFIETGTRDMSVLTWGSIIRITDEGNNAVFPQAAFHEFFKWNGREYQSDNVLLINAIQRWCQWPTGLYDLLNTMHILFGAAQ